MRFVKLGMSLGCCLIFIISGMVQDETPTPYQRALEKIHEAEQEDSDVLWLSGMELTELPPEIGTLTNLVVLYIDSNQLKTLPKEIGNLHNLRWLDATQNQLKKLPPELGKLTNLKQLRLGHNNLHDLPQEIGNLHKLCVLRLESNNLQHLPVAIGQLTLLTDKLNGCHLAFQDNPLSLPREVIVEGISGILEYLQNQATWHLQQVILSTSTGIGLVLLFVIGLRWRMQRTHQKSKHKEKIA